MIFRSKNIWKAGECDQSDYISIVVSHGNYNLTIKTIIRGIWATPYSTCLDLVTHTCGGELDQHWIKSYWSSFYDEEKDAYPGGSGANYIGVGIAKAISPIWLFYWFI